jgi:alpha-1,3-rhamnosyl/mannosyltransferase
VRVVVNLLAAAGAKTGVGHYAVELFRCLQQQAGPGEIHDFPHPRVLKAKRFLTHVYARAARGGENPQGGRTSILSQLRNGAVNQLRAGARAAIGHHFRARCAAEKYDLYHEPNFIPLDGDVPTVATIHDLSCVLHPEWHPAARVAHFERHFRAGLDRCVHFFAISETARQELIRTLGLAPAQVTRTYMGVRPDLGPLPAHETAATLSRLGLPARYLLYFGTLEPRKNVLMLMRAYCSLPSALRERWPLVLVGGWGWRTAEIADYYHAAARHKNVHHVGYVADTDVAAIYNGARALVYPSLYEGFGMPPVEMLACGGAVLASTAGPLVETLAGQAHLVNADDLDGWRSALARVVDDDAWWQSLRHGAIDRARPFTWENCAADTLTVYRRLCATQPQSAPGSAAA